MVVPSQFKLSESILSSTTTERLGLGAASGRAAQVGGPSPISYYHPRAGGLDNATRPL